MGKRIVKIIITGIVFLFLISISIWAENVKKITFSNYEKKCKEYLEFIPSDGRLYFDVSISTEVIASFGNLGKDWSSSHYFNEVALDSSPIEIDYYRVNTFKSKYEEHDDSLSDIGEGISNGFSLRNTYQPNYPFEIEVDVLVEERGGNGNNNSYIIFQDIYSLTRVLPPLMSQEDILLWNCSESEGEYYRKILSDIILVEKYYGGIKFLDFLFGFLFVINVGGLIIDIIELRNTEKRKAIREKELEEKRTIFYRTLNGKSIREYSNVPTNVRFVNDLPVDNNDSLYGSYTVYLTKNGKSFHEREGCCSSKHPIHFIEARKQGYRPCSKCCANQYIIPEWMKTYDMMKKMAESCEVDINY